MMMLNFRRLKLAHQSVGFSHFSGCDMSSDSGSSFMWVEESSGIQCTYSLHINIYVNTSPPSLDSKYVKHDELAGCAGAQGLHGKSPALNVFWDENHHDYKHKSRWVSAAAWSTTLCNILSLAFQSSAFFYAFHRTQQQSLQQNIISEQNLKNCPCISEKDSVWSVTSSRLSLGFFLFAFCHTWTVTICYEPGRCQS